MLNYNFHCNFIPRSARAVMYKYFRPTWLFLSWLSFREKRNLPSFAWTTQFYVETCQSLSSLIGFWDKIMPIAYKLQLPERSRIHPFLHVSKGKRKNWRCSNPMADNSTIDQWWWKNLFSSIEGLLKHSSMKDAIRKTCEQSDAVVSRHSLMGINRKSGLLSYQNWFSPQQKWSTEILKLLSMNDYCTTRLLTDKRAAPKTASTPEKQFPQDNQHLEVAQGMHKSRVKIKAKLQPIRVRTRESKCWSSKLE